MNGEPLPVEHGFPVRMVVPGLYGYVSACKWVTELELTRFADFDAYWVPRGWSPQGPIKTQSRIDTPRGRNRLTAGPVTVAGVAWAQHRGIRRVEVRVDDGPWQEAELAPTVSVDTWVQWSWRWDATAGRAPAPGPGDGRDRRNPDRAYAGRRPGRRHRLAHGHRHRPLIRAVPGGPPGRSRRSAVRDRPAAPRPVGGVSRPADV